MKRLCTLFIIPLFLFSCKMKNEGSSESKYQTNSAISKAKKLEEEFPFVGKKSFETKPAIAGSGTPHKYVEISKNGDVFFSFEQENQADGTTTLERYYAGKFRRIIKCSFSKLGEVSYYTIEKEKIYEVTPYGEKITSEDCCGADNIDMKDKCPCESNLYDID